MVAVNVMRYAGRPILLMASEMKLTAIFAFTFFVLSTTVVAQTPEVSNPDTVIVRSNTVFLRGLVWRPTGKGPYPAVLFNHGRSGTFDERRAKTNEVKVLGELFARHGYICLVLFRRGEGLSLDRGVHIGQLLDQERISKGVEAASRLQVELLETRELTDALAALAFLKSITGVDSGRIGVVGHSFGGSLALLIAARDTMLKAVVDFAGGAASWNVFWFRTAMLDAVKRLRSSVFFVFASNDYSVEAGRALDAEMAREGQVHQFKIFPPSGQSAADGHRFIYSAVDRWESAVFAFLDEHMRR